MPSDIPTPEISWDPAPPVIPDDPYAQAVYDYLVASALANNHHDFLDRAALDSATEGRIIAMYENLLEDSVSFHKDWWHVKLGPTCSCSVRPPSGPAGLRSRCASLPGSLGDHAQAARAARLDAHLTVPSWSSTS